MTNKINGIDVSECKYAADTIPVDCQNNTCFCYEDENCYFKQLKRLQEENEKQKEQIKQLEDFIKSDGEIDHINHEYTYKLKKENEELKEERSEVARLFDKTCRCDDLQEDTAKCQYFNDDCISIRHCMKKFRSLKDSYKQALEEIRSYCDEQNLKADYTACYITNRIDEVLNDRN